MPESSVIIVSQPSLQQMAETLDKHAEAKFAAKGEAKVAKEWGDLSENAEYRASKEKFRLAGKLQQRVGRELKRLEDHGYLVVNPMDWCRPRSKPALAEVGVVVRVEQGGVAEDYLLAGAKDTSLPEASVIGVPYTSPLGAALYRQAAPAVIQAMVAGELRTLRLLSLRRPRRAEIVELFPELSLER